MSKITVKAKVTDDSKTKLRLLSDEYNHFQQYLNDEQTDNNVNLYSATKQQADKLLKKLKERYNKNKNYPLILRRDLIDIQKDSKFPCVYWIKVPVYPKSINLRIQTPCVYDLTKYDIRESKVIKREEEKWYIYITIEKKNDQDKEEEEEQQLSIQNILAIDLGVRHIAVTVNTANTRPNFYGQNLREIRGWYFWLRRKLGQKKGFYKIKALKNTEFLQVNHELHIISRQIVEEAQMTNAIIVVGKLKGIRNRIKAADRRIKRLINNFPYYRLVQYIKYKAEWLGIKVIEVSECYTSQTCHNCHTKDKGARRVQGLYECKNCKVSCNADYNGSMNIMQRALGILSSVGGTLTNPAEPLVIVERNKMITRESHIL
jgi:putative transposase